MGGKLSLRNVSLHFWPEEVPTTPAPVEQTLRIAEPPMGLLIYAGAGDSIGVAPADCTVHRFRA